MAAHQAVEQIWYVLLLGMKVLFSDGLPRRMTRRKNSSDEGWEKKKGFFGRGCYCFH